MSRVLPYIAAISRSQPTQLLAPASRNLNAVMRARIAAPSTLAISRRAFSQSSIRRAGKKSDDDGDSESKSKKPSAESSEKESKKSKKDEDAKSESKEAAADEKAFADSKSEVVTKEPKAVRHRIRNTESKAAASSSASAPADSTPESSSKDSKESKDAKESKSESEAKDSLKERLTSGPVVTIRTVGIPSDNASDSSSGSFVPENITELMALPIVSRPIFPKFYKAVVLHDERHIEAILELKERGFPYVGVFLQKDPNPKTEAIMAPDEIYYNGVLAQITSIFPRNISRDGVQSEGLTIMLYPHKRIEVEEVFIAKHPEKPIESRNETESSSTTDVTSFDVVADEAKGVPEKDPVAFLRDSVTTVRVKDRPDLPVDKQDPTVKALMAEVVALLKEISMKNPSFRDQITSFTLSLSNGNVLEEPVRLSDFASAVCGGDALELQELMDIRDPVQRLEKGIVLLKKELMTAKLQNKISKDVESKIQKRQREYFLMEQMRVIRKELGMESDGKDKQIEKFKERAAKLNMPEAAQVVFDEELNKLMSLEPSGSEYNVTLKYLDWITQLPWGITSPENYSVKHAVDVLDEDHYGMKDVKDRILEFIAVGKLRGNVDGKILCFVGPPGVGKTSIGKSIARALGRQFQRFSVGGLADVAEIKGHRRTYVGALPGRIIQSLKNCQTENPLILIDEVDKVGHGHQGDPKSALLELLDPEQNNSFLDHYLDIPVDVSKVLFVCTANMIDTIPQPLLDRMEIIEVSGYIAEEKMAIASKYLVPQARENSGLKDVNVELTDEAIERLIKSYCRESGVRNLKKQIEKVYRKAALEIVKDIKEPEVLEAKVITAEAEAKAPEADAEKAVAADAEKTEGAETAEGEAKAADADAEKAAPEQPQVQPLVVPDSVHIKLTAENLADYVGPPIYTSDKLYDEQPPTGVITGLAWTQMGGTCMYVESVVEAPLVPSSTQNFKYTGMLGDVMKESTAIAYTFAKMFIASHFPENRFFEHARIHMHCPEGATPKDGPSAGVTISTSLLSLALNKPVDPGFAMTGEITVTGRILRIGGLREKTVAAKRAGAKTVFFPAGNVADWEALPDVVKEGIEGVPCHFYSDIFNRCFAGISQEEGNKVWFSKLGDPNDPATQQQQKQSQQQNPTKDGGLGDLFPPLGGSVNTEIRAAYEYNGDRRF